MRKKLGIRTRNFESIPPLVDVVNRAVELLKDRGVKKGENLCPHLVVTTIKSQINPTSIVIGVPQIIWFQSKPTAFKVPLRGRVRPAIIPIEQIQARL